MLHKLHRLSASLISLYILFHLLNHLTALAGIQAHIDYMRAYRLLYRFPPVETLLLACVLFQTGSGLYFVWARRGRRQGFFDHAQAWSGLYLAFFLLFHLSAVLYGRWGQGVDTNFYFAAAGLNLGNYFLFFMPYYFLSIVAYFTHIGCGLRWLLQTRLGPRGCDRLAGGMMAVGALLSGIIIATFSGAWYLVSIPSAYQFAGLAR
ncbi:MULTISPECIES: hypothetical protein [Chromobacterium]|uniref:Succinate dehydrogenase n=1 Tax=Chromobacterium rhizoryzae TaxID=1778675 RepID=A0AAD0RW88_9NEIS|nr:MULTISPECIES: hypothetical protein [Chromobacterium]AXT48645.1 hypothetical protein D1345_21855 [Chromobacterium rhizoryzae]QOD82625.1 hypothetical protein IEZ30_22655 [Chromobacterium haemolyticum]